MRVLPTRLARITAVVVAAIGFTISIAGQNVDQKPLRDFAKEVQAKIDNKEVDVTKPFSLEMAAVFTGEGRLDREASKFTSESGDAKMVEVAKQAVYAMGDSGYFSYLTGLGISRATLNVTQTTQSFTGSVRASENRFRAAMIATGVGAALSIAKTQELGANEKLIVENTRATRDGGDIDITCTLPAAEFQRMILGRTAAAAPVN